jgi:hypothetical protein
VHDERDAAGVVLESRVVEALLLRWGCARLADVVLRGRVLRPVSAERKRLAV